MSDSRFLSINQLAKLTGKDRQTIARRLSEVEPAQADKRGKYYDAWAALPLIYAGDNKTGLTQKIQQAELEIQKEKLQKIRFENEKTAGQLVDIEDVVKAIEKEYGFVKSQLLTIPSKLAKKLSIESDPHKVFDELHSTIDEILTELVSDKKYEDDSVNLNLVREKTLPAIEDSKPEDDNETTE
jgi:phage terminase Nu1 subunit (DNA packaging protein)